MDIDLQEVKEYHAGFIFGKPDNSIGVDKDDKPYDYGFNTQVGRVNYEKQSDDVYLVTISDKNFLEKRILDLETLKGWFYDPSEDYYKSNIINLEKVE